MARWEPGARERLQGAALERFAALGLDGTTVAEIAAAAGVTERTFFRHFADKREVLFAGQDLFQQLFVDGIAHSPSTAPMGMVATALERGGAFFTDDRRAWSRGRQVIIDADPGLRERELYKMATLATAIAAGLRARGVDATTAALAAETGVAVLRVGFATWIAEDETRPFDEIVTALLASLRALVAGLEPGA